MIFEQFIKANSYPVGKNKSFSTTEFIIKWFCLSMNLLHQLLSGSEEDEEEEQSFVRAERRNREQQEWQFSSEWDEKVMQSLPYRRRLKNLVPWQKVGKMLSYTKMECAHSGFPRLFILPCSWRSCPGFAMALVPCLAFDLYLHLLN